MKDSITQKQILLALTNGDEHAFEDIYEQYFQSVYIFVLAYVKSPDLAQDICQEIFMKVWNKREQFAQVLSFKHYLFTLAKNHTLNQLRKISRSNASLQEVLRYYPIAEQTTGNNIQHKEYEKFIEEAYEKLSPTAKRVFTLCREQQMTYDQVAEEMGFSRDAVKKYMVQTMKTFRSLLSGPLDIQVCLFVCMTIDFIFFNKI
ncbi:RNA polymerase sigma factor [Sphingobacterium spiritivorum]|uniref:RNA polymerase sigma factor n=1 Tax=Sphingobacterium spiritivorum TaxID=258 RepID=UPI00191978FE|nr:RNA polymerase sigma-70 factor [Sphingobacterium spiritivorum]QQT25523.1 RNA polymerase sigma-70 factor [Sphingobacterium spiritivorum]